MIYGWAVTGRGSRYDGTCETGSCEDRFVKCKDQSSEVRRSLSPNSVKQTRGRATDDVRERTDQRVEVEKHGVRVVKRPRDIDKRLVEGQSLTSL